MQELLSHIADVTEIAAHINTFDKIVFIGTGGSSLVGQALKSIAPLSQQEKFIFFDNIDPRTFREKISTLNKEKTFFVIVSKSGKTSEVLTQTLSLADRLTTNVLVITENKDSPLSGLATHYKWKTMEHPNIGGRFSAFSIVGLLPCALLGLSSSKFIVGAKNALDHQAVIQEKVDYVYKTYPTNKQVILSYSDYTNGALGWMSQLIAESLGKRDDNGDPKGITPITAKGTIDQHSQLQLWMDGPKDQFFQIYFFNDPQDQTKLSVDFAFAYDELRKLDKLSYNQILKAHSLATAQALQDVGYYVDYKEYPMLNEETLGYIMMEKFIETFQFAKQMQIDPEGQPGVENAKKLIGVYL